MARSLYGGRLGDTVVSLFQIGTRSVLALPADANGSPTATVLEVYDEPDGTSLTDLLTYPGEVPITAITVPADGQIPAFKGPDGYGDGLWLRDPDGDYYRLDAKGAAGPEGGPGPAGRSVVSIARTSGTGAPGTTDTYTITYSDATTSTFQVYNGSNGTGTGDVVGPAGAMADRIAVFNGTTGKLIKDGGVAVSALQPADTDLTAIAALTTTTFGRAFLTLADAAAGRGAIEAAGSTGGGREKSAALSATTGTATGNLANASVFTVTPTGNLTLAFSNVPASGTACTATVIVSQGATVRTVTAPSGTKWMGGAAPTQVASKACAFTFVTVDGGTTWYASAAVEQ